MQDGAKTVKMWISTFTIILLLGIRIADTIIITLIQFGPTPDSMILTTVLVTGVTFHIMVMDMHHTTGIAMDTGMDLVIILIMAITIIMAIDTRIIITTRYPIVMVDAEALTLTPDVQQHL